MERKYDTILIIFYPSAECAVNQYVMLWLKGKLITLTKELNGDPY